MKKVDIHVLTNEAKVLSILYSGRLTRSEISKITGLGYSSVSYIVLRLESLGLIRTVGMKRIKNGPPEDVYEISEKGIDTLKKILSIEAQYIEILLKLKETAAVSTTTT
jgi:DNA-binding PadR family transcriptional regulator